MNYPNKIYVSEFKGNHNITGQYYFLIVTAACDSVTAREYVKEKIGIDVEPVWLMNAVYPTIYTSNGNAPLEKQVKILSNNNLHY